MTAPDRTVTTETTFTPALDAAAGADADPPLGTAWSRPTRTWWAFLLVALLPPLLGFALVRAVFAHETGSPLTAVDGEAWGRWDTGNYGDIAEHGYYWGPCAEQGRAVHGDICSPAAWYPAFPYLGRWVARVTGWSIDNAFVGIAQLAFLALLCVVWIGYLRARLTARHLLLFALAVFFPGGVYLLAEFPISLLTALLAAQILCFTRERWVLGAVFGALASLCYPITVVLPFASAVWVVLVLRARAEPWRRSLGLAAVTGAIVTAGSVAVFTLHQIVLGDWAASFKEQQKFGGTVYNPVFNWWHTVVKQNSWIQRTYPETARVIAAQTLLVTIIVVACVAVVVFVKRRRTAHDLGLLVLLVGLWLLPLSSNIETGLYRRVAPLLPAAVLLLRRAPWPVQAGLALASAGVWWWMVPKFYSGALI